MLPLFNRKTRSNFSEKCLIENKTSKIENIFLESKKRSNNRKYIPKIENKSAHSSIEY